MSNNFVSEKSLT